VPGFGRRARARFRRNGRLAAFPQQLIKPPPEPAILSLFVFRNAQQIAVLWSVKLVRIGGNRGEGLNPKDCPCCGGTGYVAKPVDLNGKSEGVAFIRVRCPACAGSGRRNPTLFTTG